MKANQEHVQYDKYLGWHSYGFDAGNRIDQYACGYTVSSLSETGFNPTGVPTY